MKIARVVLAVAVLAAAAYAIRQRPYERYRCNRDLKLVQARIDTLSDVHDPARIAIGTRETLAVLVRCKAALPASVHVRKFIADSYLLRDDYENARLGYLEALQVDRRPEIYQDLGLATMRLGRTQEAFDHFVTSSLVRPDNILLIDEPMRSAVAMAVTRQLRAAEEREKQPTR